jgi:hypothetical protein
MSIAKFDAGIGIYAKFNIRTILVLNMPSHFLSQAAAMKKKDTCKMAVGTKPLKKQQQQNRTPHGCHTKNLQKAPQR